MLKMRQVTEMYEMKVFTDTGDYFGDIEEAIVTTNKVHGWRIRASRNSFLSKVLGGAKGVIVPHQYVKSVGDVVIISKQAIPTYEESEEEQK